MREKLIATAFILILFCANFAIANGCNNNTKNASENAIQAGLPDLICDIWFEEVNDEGHYKMMFNITNIGYGIAKMWTLNATWYPIGALPFHILGITIFNNPLFLKIAVFLFYHFHIDLGPFTYEYHPSEYYGSIYPGETIEIDGTFSFYPPGFEFISNTNIGFVLIAEADPEQKCIESNEGNNKAVEHWWFPDFSEPPSHQY